MEVLGNETKKQGSFGANLYEGQLIMIIVL